MVIECMDFIIVADILLTTSDKLVAKIKFIFNSPNGQPVNENMLMNKKKNEDGKKRLSIERIYQKKTQLEHILLRPDTYIGSVELVTQQMWI